MKDQDRKQVVFRGTWARWAPGRDETLGRLHIELTLTASGFQATVLDPMFDEPEYGQSGTDNASAVTAIRNALPAEEEIMHWLTKHHLPASG